MTAQLIDGKAVAAKLKEELQKEINELKAKYNSAPLLTAVQVGKNAASEVYLANQKKGCEAIGIGFQVKEFPETISEADLLKQIGNLNSDKSITGIILQMPLPKQIRVEKAQAAIDPLKDVEGVNPYNLGKLVLGSAQIVPCTAMAVMELLKSTGIPLKGKQVTIVGHSAIVGKPLALLMLASLTESATPTVCHIATRNLAEQTRQAEILIVAVGKAGLIKGEMIKEGAIVIDVGINRIEGKLVGDVVFEEAKEKASLITPVPGGVGPVTTVLLLRNNVLTWKNQLNIV